MCMEHCRFIESKMFWPHQGQCYSTTISGRRFLKHSWPQDGSILPKTVPILRKKVQNITPRWSKMGQDGLRWLQDGPRWSPHCHNMGENKPKLATMVPWWRQDGRYCYCYLPNKNRQRRNERTNEGTNERTIAKLGNGRLCFKQVSVQRQT